MRPFFCVLLVVSGCGILGPDERREYVVSTTYTAEPQLITMPDSARAGIPFNVTYYNWGGGCDDRDKGYIAVSREGAVTVLTPYDYSVTVGNCESIAFGLRKTVSLTLSAVGRSEIHFRARRPGSSLTGKPDTTIVRFVTVQ